jgi:hypothetical protein
MISYFVIRRLAVPGLFENFWSTGSIGGIGMLLGHKLDNGLLLNAEHIHHHGHSMAAVEVLPMLISNMTLMMLIFCVPSCVLCCNHCLSNISLPKKLVLHAGNLVSMLMGMIVAVKSAPWMFLGNVANPVVEHYFMVSQMLLFSAFSYIFIYPNLTRINGSHSPLSGA